MRNTVFYFVFATLLFAESVTMTIPANKEQFTNIAFLKTGQMFSIDHISGYATFSGDNKLRDAYGRNQQGETCNTEGGMVVLEPGVEYVWRHREEAPYFFSRFAEKALGKKYHARGDGYLRVKAFDREGSYADNKHGSYTITITIYPFEQKNSTIPTPQFHDDLAFHWAPIHYQDTAKEQWLADALTRVNYDGDWKTDNNWDALHNTNSDLRGAVYYFVLETPTHWFVNYSFYHPRDWVNPWDLETDHENDLEGIIVAVKKDGSRFGKLEGIVTCAHLDFYSYIPEDSELQGNKEDIDGKLIWQRDHENNNRFCTYQEAKGHGCHALQKKHTFGSENDYIVYYPSITGSVPESRFDQQATYQLINIFSPGELWSRRFAKETFKKFGVFLKSKGSGGNANTPWTWDDKDDGDLLQGGEMALDPAQLFSIYYKTPQMVKEYVYNPFQGIWK